MTLNGRNALFGKKIVLPPEKNLNEDISGKM